MVLDSVQTVYSEKLGSAPGSISQVREVATQFLLLSKQRSIPAFLIGHITKDGALAGPKSLEHIVDTVLYFEGERYHSHRIVRTVKNRFGAANELGIFEMTNEGLIPVANPSKLFLSERPAGASGSVVIGCVEGSRPILVELQALVSGTNYASPRRMAAGVDPNRVSLLLAMLDKRMGMHLGGSDVYVNVAGGLTVDEPAADLGIVASIVSSFRNRAIASDRVSFRRGRFGGRSPRNQPDSAAHSRSSVDGIQAVHPAPEQSAQDRASAGYRTDSCAERAGGNGSSV